MGEVPGLMRLSEEDMALLVSRFDDNVGLERILAS